MKAIWKDEILAESDETVIVEGNHYFPPEAIKSEYFQESHNHTVCPWKGAASYYNIVVNGDVNQNAAWFYPTASHAAKRIEGYVAFWHGVRVVP